MLPALREDEPWAARLREPLRIGSLEIPNRALLAPLAGVSDAPFRRICQELGAGLTFVEMLSAVAVIRGNGRTEKMRERRRDEPVVGVQLTGRSPEEVAAAVSVLDGEGYDVIDLNMGCPVRKVVSSGCGSAILRDPERVEATVAAARAATRRPLSVKCRIGFDRTDVNVEKTAERVVRAGADLLTVHGRTRSERYDVPVDLAAIRDAVASARRHAGARFVPVAGNGDLLDARAAAGMLAETGCDALMVSRGALGNPWIFRELVEEGAGPPTLAEWADVLLRHLDYQETFYEDARRGAVLFRKHLSWYARGFPGARRLRDQLFVVETISDARELVTRFVRALPAALPRFSGA